MLCLPHRESVVKVSRVFLHYSCTEQRCITRTSGGLVINEIFRIISQKMDVSQEMNVSSLTQTGHYSSAIYLATQ